MALCIRSASRKSFRCDAGSAVVGFSMIAPLVIAVFITVVNVSSIVSTRAVLTSAAHTGGRVAANYGATHQMGLQAARQIMESKNLDTAQVSFHNEVVQGVDFVVVTVTYKQHVSWLNRDVELVATSRTVNENAL